MTEDHTLDMEDPTVFQVRRVLLECGWRLKEAGALEREGDVFYLTLDELRETMSALPWADRRRLADERKAEMERFRSVTPPPFLGTMPPGPPPESPVTRAHAKFTGAPPLPSDDPAVLRGSPGSRGTARGPARVLRSLDEAGKLQPGAVLVAEATRPTWTPLFTIASAVVTDTGGFLGHSALVAREYRIPAVVGTDRATSVINDGQVVEVNGYTGEVRLLPQD